MSKAPYCEPRDVTIPAAGGQVKFRLKNPDTKKFLYQLDISNPNEYTVDMAPTGLLPMGENKVVEVTKKAGAAGEAKLKFQYFEIISTNPQECVASGTPAGAFECKIVAK